MYQTICLTIDNAESKLTPCLGYHFLTPRPPLPASLVLICQRIFWTSKRFNLPSPSGKGPVLTNRSLFSSACTSSLQPSKWNTSRFSICLAMTHRAVLQRRLLLRAANEALSLFTMLVLKQLGSKSWLSGFHD